MTDDLVKRLRDGGFLMVDDRSSIKEYYLESERLKGEAADRIEKLEAALRWVLACETVSFRSADFHGSNCNCRRCAMDNAQHVMEGKDD